MKAHVPVAALIIMLAGVGSLATTAMAYRGEGDRRPGECVEGNDRHPDRLERMARLLELSSAQRQQIETIVADAREANRPLRDQLRANRRAIREAAAKEPIDEVAIRELTASAADLKAELTIRRAQTRRQIDLVLTPDQRDLLERARPLIKGRHGGHSKHQRGPGPGPAEPADS